MRDRRLKRPVSDAARTVMSLATNATYSDPHSKLRLLGTFAALLFLGAFAALLVVIAVPMLSRADMPPMPVNSTLKCYDSVGQYEPCVTRASASRLGLNGRTTGTDQLASWTTTALYQVDQPENLTTSAPVVRRSNTSGRHRALAICRRRLIPCLLSTLRRGLTHIASVAATVGQARPAREHL